MLRNIAYTPPAAIYVALFTAVTGLEANAPTAEVSGGSYARVACVLTAAAAGLSSNNANITFPTATVAWGTVSHFCLCDHLTNVTWGTNVNVLMWSALDTAKAIDIGDTAQFNTGDLDVAVD